jgi:hypothetical protein
VGGSWWGRHDAGWIPLRIPTPTPQGGEGRSSLSDTLNWNLSNEAQVAPTQDALVERAVRDMAGEYRDELHFLLWAQAGQAPDFQAELQEIWDGLAAPHRNVSEAEVEIVLQNFAMHRRSQDHPGCFIYTGWPQGRKVTVEVEEGTNPTVVVTVWD